MLVYFAKLRVDFGTQEISSEHHLKSLDVHSHSLYIQIWNFQRLCKTRSLKIHTHTFLGHAALKNDVHVFSE